MPKIKAYKGNRVIIPVEGAKIVTAFRCPWTSKIFANKKSYVKHLRELRTDRIHRNIRARIRNKIFEELINQDSFEKVIEWIETHPEIFFDRAIERGRVGWSDRREHLREKFWIKITFLDVGWSDSVSNSHSCPRGGVTCWSSQEARDGRPRGYPGWHGRVDWLVEWPRELDSIYLGSDLFSRGTFRSGRQRAHTGSGGGGGGHMNREFNTWCQRPGYSFSIFASDWPGMARYYEKRRVWGTLSNQKEFA